LSLWLAGCLIATATPAFVPGRILVKPRAGLSETNLGAKLKRFNAADRRSLPRFRVRVVAVPEEAADAVLAELKRDPDIEFAERDYIARAAFLPNDPLVVSNSAWHLPRIQADLAWNTTAGATNTVVAVLDSGVNAAHPDLAGQVLPGYDFVNVDADPADDLGHGTAVSGAIAAAGNNGRGAAGVAFGCRLLPVKVMNASGFATYSCIAEGIEYAVDRGARVINISIVGTEPSGTLQDAINDAWSNNVVIVAAAGNTADDTLQYPAACAHVVGVSATEPDDTLAAFSSYGSDVSLAAPGDNIWTTQNQSDHPYGEWRGTSLASPIVAGAAALVAAENPSLSNTQIVSLLEQNADDLGAVGGDPLFGCGRVNAYRAVGAASMEPGALPPSPPPAATSPDASSSATDTNLPSVTLTQPGGNGARLKAPLTLVVRGGGRVVPNRNGKLLELGRTYVVKAVPQPGQVFAGWNGVPSSSPVLRFTMQSNLTLTVDFVPNPFLPAKGGYGGLVLNPAGVLPDNSGCFRLMLTSGGRFTGRVWIGGRGHGFHGALDLAGDAAVSVGRGALSPLTLTLHVDLTNGADQIAGSVSDGGWTSALAGDRNVFNARSNPARQAGRHAFILEHAGDSAVAAAAGASVITRNGSARIRGRLEGGAAFSTGSLLAKNGDCPFCLSLNRGTEIVIGWLNFSATNRPAASGTVLWVRTGANAFGATLRAAAP
jgi:subtilisin family serine protease